MLNNIRKIQQRAQAIETNYKKFNEWLNEAHATYTNIVAPHTCPIPSGRPCLDLDCLGFDGREQNK